MEGDILGLKSGLHYTAELLDLLARLAAKGDLGHIQSDIAPIAVEWVKEWRGITTLSELAGDPFSKSRHMTQELVKKYGG